jgi:hypothetical protein
MEQQRKDLSAKELLRLFVATVGPGKLPRSQNPSDLLVTEHERQAQGQRLALLIEQDDRAGKPTLSDKDLQRLHRALLR